MSNRRKYRKTNIDWTNPEERKRYHREYWIEWIATNREERNARIRKRRAERIALLRKEKNNDN